MVDNLSSEWKHRILNGHGAGGAAIITAGWLHNGHKREIQIDKVIPAPGAEPAKLGEKISRVKFAPTLAEMGGCGVDGVFGVTTQGSLIVHVFNNFEPDRVSNITKQLTLPSWHFTHADFAYRSNGRLLIALGVGLINKPIRLLEVTMSKCNPFQRASQGDNELRLELEELPSLLFGEMTTTDPSFFHQDCFLSHLCFPHHEYADQLITVYSNEKQSVLAWWMLRNDTIQVPALLGGQIQSKTWKCVNNVTLDRITSITSHSLPVQPDKFYNSNFSCGHLLAIACLSGSFYLVHKLKLDVLRRDDYTQLVRQSELPGNINEDSLRVCVSATFSPTGCALFTLDNMARISVIQVQPWRDAEVPLSQKEAAIGVLLSYAMLADVDSWDTRNLLNDLAKKDSEIVRRLDRSLQSAVESDGDFHQPYLASCQAQRILLLGRLERFQADYSAALSAILSRSFLSLFTSLLRPLRTNLDELSAGEKLRDIAVSRAEPDLESALSQILSAFETDPRILAKIPHLVQWVTHLILWQTARVKTTMMDKEELSRARQLLIIIRLWSHLMSSCSPQFTTKDANIDVLSELFRLLTLMWASKEKDEPISTETIDQCANLRGRVYIQSPHLELPFRPELNHAKIEIGSYPKIFATSGAITRDTVDFVRRTKMGVNEVRHLRRCSRSGVCTQKRTETPLPVWDDRFVQRTFCLGLWTRAIPSRKRPAVDITQELLEF